MRWKSSTSDQFTDLPMSKRKLTNFHPKCGIESGSASEKARVDENSAGPSSSVVDVIEYCSSSSDNEDKDEDEKGTGVDDSSDNVLDELKVNGRKWECMLPHLNKECPRKMAMHPRVKPFISSISR